MTTPTGKSLEPDARTDKPVRPYPELETSPEGVVQIKCAEADTLTRLYGVQTHDAASGLMKSAMNALGRTGEDYRPFIASMTAELEPRDAIEAMLVTQMVATHVAITTLGQKMADQGNLPAKETYERSLTRLSRTFLSQVDTLKKYRAKAQQVVRVERVTVQDGGQAIVGNVAGPGGGHDENRR